MRIASQSLLIGLLFFVVGCTKTVTVEETEQVKSAVTQGLEAWKGKKAAASLPDQWQFLDEDWKANHPLAEYTITNVTIEKDDMHRCWVTLKITKQGKAQSKEICYIVDLKRKLINRDPYS
jgi:hypothetical protein